MVKFEVDKTAESEFLDEIETVEIEDINIPVPPKELLTDNMSNRKKEKVLKKYQKKLSVQSMTENISRLKEKKNRYLTNQIQLEKEYLAHRPFLLRIKEFFRASRYLRIGLIYHNGAIKWYDRPITKDNSNVRVRSGLYLINKRAMIYTSGRPTFLYFAGNSNPIIFDHDKHDILISSTALYGLFQSKVLGEMFRGMSTGKAIAWSFGIIVAIGIAGMLILSTAGTSLGEIMGKKAGVFLLWKIRRK